jgi:hypothetical protein
MGCISRKSVVPSRGLILGTRRVVRIWADRVSRFVLATSDFLENIVTLLRKFAQLAGLIVVVVACIELVINPHLSLDYLTLPGGILAIVQGFIKPRKTHGRDEETGRTPASPSSPAGGRDRGKPPGSCGSSPYG